MKPVKASLNYRMMVAKAILSIIFFIASYLLLIFLAIGFVFLCGLGAIAIIGAHPSFLTLMIGIGIICMALLVLLFLLKFIVSKHVADRSHLVEITEEQEPNLFAFIREIVKEADTAFPKKIFLSADVNASVFYDSGFWSMFLPVKKNLQIGMGLVKSVTLLELKAILAHEFGHFSQSSMKVGSYVYFSNNVIYNMLFDNEGYNQLAVKIASINGYLDFFVLLAIKIIEGIRFVLHHVYAVVNINYLSLSREMEFQADEIAANIAGSSPLAKSLLRLELASFSFYSALNYYQNKTAEAVTTLNIYPQQLFVMNFLAQQSKIETEHNLPLIDIENSKRYNKSKLVIKDQWASHPSTEDRILALTELNITGTPDDGTPAVSVFFNPRKTELELTKKLFSDITAGKEFVETDYNKFVEDYTAEYNKYSFGKIFNGYYDNKDPKIDLEYDSNSDSNLTADTAALFSKEKVDLVYTKIALESDLETLKQLQSGNFGIKTLDYDGKKYNVKNIALLLPELENALTEINEKINLNDSSIFKLLWLLSVKTSNADEMKNLVENIKDATKTAEEKMKIYSKMIQDTAFLSVTTPFDVIASNLEILSVTEKEFKEEIRSILTDKSDRYEASQDAQDAMRKYLTRNWIYFTGTEYCNDELGYMYAAMNHYNEVVTKSYFNAKKKLLAFMESVLASANK